MLNINNVDTKHSWNLGHYENIKNNKNRLRWINLAQWPKNHKRVSLTYRQKLHSKFNKVWKTTIYIGPKKKGLLSQSNENIKQSEQAKNIKICKGKKMSDIWRLTY